MKKKKNGDSKRKKRKPEQKEKTSTNQKQEMEGYAKTSCTGVCRALARTEYSDKIKKKVQDAHRGDAVCVAITVRDQSKRDAKPKEIPFLLYAHSKRPDVPYCDQTRTLGAYRLVVKRSVKRIKLAPGTASPYDTRCDESTASAGKLAKLGHEAVRSTRSDRSSFKPHVGDIKHKDAPLSANLPQLVTSGSIQRVVVNVPRKERKLVIHKEAKAICTVCSFYLAADVDRSMGASTTGCYYLYNKESCPHTRDASADEAGKLNGTQTISMKELSRYVVTLSDGAEVDLAKWIYSKFYGTSYVGEGTKGRCLTDGLPSVGGREAGAGIRLADRDVPRHVPLSTLRVVVGPK